MKIGQSSPASGSIALLSGQRTTHLSRLPFAPPDAVAPAAPFLTLPLFFSPSRSARSMSRYVFGRACSSRRRFTGSRSTRLVRLESYCAAGSSGAQLSNSANNLRTRCASYPPVVQLPRPPPPPPPPWPTVSFPVRARSPRRRLQSVYVLVRCMG